jgi:hypothetical protein
MLLIHYSLYAEAGLKKQWILLRIHEAELPWEQTQDTGKVKPRVYLGRKNANWKATMSSSGGGAAKTTHQ